MKKINLIILFLAVLTSKIFSEDIKIYAPVAQKMLIDKNDYVRYSPVNMFDNKSDSVFAVTFDEINKKRPLLEIYFADPATFDSISIKAGYFDKRYFEKNTPIGRELQPLLSIFRGAERLILCERPLVKEENPTV